MIVAVAALAVALSLSARAGDEGASTARSNASRASPSCTVTRRSGSRVRRRSPSPAASPADSSSPYLFVRDEHGRLRDFRTWTTGSDGPRSAVPKSILATTSRRVSPKRPISRRSLRAIVNRFHGFKQLREELVGDRPAVVIHSSPARRSGGGSTTGGLRVDPTARRRRSSRWRPTRPPTGIGR